MARILIVEDEPLIAMMLSDWLEELGHEPIGPAFTVDDAIARIGRDTIDAAIVDLNLRGRRSDPVAAALVERSLPFAFATGDHADSVGDEYKNRPLISKPYSFAAFADTVEALIASTGGRHIGQDLEGIPGHLVRSA
jgi:DNA-binding response OmpR family regulator